MPETRHKKSALAVYTGLVANLVLAGLKTAFGVLGHSTALLSDGINSTSDVAYYIVVSVFFRLSRKPPDKEHPYGHSQLETIAALIVGSFVVTTAVAVFWNAVNSVYDILCGAVEVEGASRVTLWVALTTVAVKIVLTLHARHLARQTENMAVSALAEDHRNDIFSSLAAGLGIFLGMRGYAWVDPLAGALVAVIILKTGIQILRESSAELMDAVPGGALEKEIRQALAGVAGIERVENIMAHRFGPYLVIGMDLCIDGTLSVAEGDAISEQAESALKDRIDYLHHVQIHYHPA